MSTLKYLSHGIEVSATSQSTADLLYECPDNFSARVVFLHVSNGSGNNKDISINFYHKADDEDHLISDAHAVSANSEYSLVTGGSSFYMQAGDRLECFAETGGDFHVTISVEEIYTPGL